MIAINKNKVHTAFQRILFKTTLASASTDFANDVEDI
jgi:hypothetical protein